MLLHRPVILVCPTAYFIAAYSMIYYPSHAAWSSLFFVLAFWFIKPGSHKQSMKHIDFVLIAFLATLLAFP